MNSRKQQIVSISKKLKLSHIGSNISVLPILEEIYKIKEPQDIVILDGAHAHLAHLLVMKAMSGKFKGVKVEDLIHDYGIHCDRRAGCDVSGGSLGHGIGIGIGYALADTNRDVYVILTEGGAMEGSTWEALRIKSDLNLTNLKVYTNFNGYSAVSEVDLNKLQERLFAFCPDIEFRLTENGEGFDGVQGHYKTI